MNKDIVYRNILEKIKKNDFVGFITLLQENKNELKELWNFKSYNKNLIQMALEEKKDYFIKELIEHGFTYPEILPSLLKEQSLEIIEYIQNDIEKNHINLKNKIVEFYIYYNTDIIRSTNFLKNKIYELDLENIIADKRIEEINLDIKKCLIELDLKIKVQEKTLSLDTAKQKVLQSIEENNFADFITYLPFIDKEILLEGKEIMHYTLSEKRDSFTKELIISGYPYAQDLSTLFSLQSDSLLQFITHHAFKENKNIKELSSALIIKSIHNSNYKAINVLLDNYSNQLDYSYLINHNNFNNLENNQQKRVFTLALQKGEIKLLPKILGNLLDKNNYLPLENIPFDSMQNKELVYFIKRSIIENNELLYNDLINKKELTLEEKEEIALLCVQKKQINLLSKIKNYSCTSGNLINTMHRYKFLDEEFFKYTEVNQKNLIALINYKYEENFLYLDRYKNYIDKDVIETISYNKSAETAIKYFNHFNIKEIDCAESIAMGCVNRKNLELLQYIFQFNNNFKNMPQMIENSVISKQFNITDFLLKNIPARQLKNKDFKDSCENAVWAMLRRNLRATIVDRENDLILSKVLNLIDCNAFHKKIIERIRPEDMSIIRAMGEKQIINASMGNRQLKETSVYKL